MENFTLIKQGAEAKIFKGIYLGKPTLIKERFEKKYRHSELDDHLTKERIKAESRAIIRCKSVGIKTPALYLVDVQKRCLFMEYFENNITAKEFIVKASNELIEKLSNDIGVTLAKMHENNIIHGDLTTSNILLVNQHKDNNFFQDYSKLKVVLIDFGLSYSDGSAENKGVDLYVLERAIISIHENPEEIFELILKAYRNAYVNGCNNVISKLDEVRLRGRKRLVIG